MITLCGLNGTPVALNLGFCPYFWYVSAMFWTLLLLFYLLKYYEKKNVDLFLAISIFIGYGICLHSFGDGDISVNTRYYYFINIGICRGIAGIGLGYFIAQWYKNSIEMIKTWKLSFLKKLLITCAEGYCLFFIVQNLIFHRLKFYNQIIFIIMFVFMILLFLMKQGYISKFFDASWTEKVGRYTYSIYVMHKIVLDLFVYIYKVNPSFAENYTYLFIILCILSVYTFGIFTYHFIEAPSVKYLKGKFLKSN